MRILEVVRLSVTSTLTKVFQNVLRELLALHRAGLGGLDQMRISIETKVFEFAVTGRDVFIEIMGRELYWKFGARPVFSR